MDVKYIRGSTTDDTSCTPYQRFWRHNYLELERILYTTYNQVNLLENRMRVLGDKLLGISVEYVFQQCSERYLTACR